MKLILVLDIGTSSVKAILFDEQSSIFAEAEAAYPTLSGAGGRQEQVPEDWIEATKQAVQLLDRVTGDIELIVLTGTMQSVIPIDASGHSLRPAMLYSDSRAEAEFADLVEHFESAGGARLIGNVPNAYMAAFKIEWVRRHEAPLFERAVTFHSGSKDFVGQWLTGAVATDPTAATTVGLMDIRSLRWDPRLLEILGLKESRLPQILPADAILGPLLAGPAAILGIRSGLPVMNGCGDAGASTLGAGIDLPGETYAYIGTTAWAAQIIEGVEAVGGNGEESIYTLAHPSSRGHYIRIGAMLSGGDSAAWFAETMGRSVEELDKLVGEPTFQPSEIMFLPYLKGERCPFMDPRVRGSFLFIERTDSAAHMHYAILEGISLAIQSNINALGPVKGDMALLGGGAVSRHLPQLLSDVCQRRVSVADRPAAATSFGAFSLGAKRLGWMISPPSVAKTVQPRLEARQRALTRCATFREATSLVRQLAAMS